MTRKTKEQMKLQEGLEELSPSVIDHLKNRGMTQSEIARMYGVTRQYISWIKHYHGSALTPREIVLQNFPFRVPTEMTHVSMYKRLRDHGEYVATWGIGMSQDKISRLRGFYSKLREEGLVVEFDPDIPPLPGVSNKGGWAYRKRRKSDEDRLIRINEYADMTEEADQIWRFPPIEPP